MEKEKNEFWSKYVNVEEEAIKEGEQTNKQIDFLINEEIDEDKRRDMAEAWGWIQSRKNKDVYYKKEDLFSHAILFVNIKKCEFWMRW
jgi:hypothetical protein